MKGKNIKKPRTPKAKKFFKLLLTANTQSEAARQAGYSEESARVSASKNMKKYGDYWKDLLKKAGCTDEHLVETITAGTCAEKVVGYLENKSSEKKGKVKKAEPDKSVSNDFVDVPDWPSRAKFTELALKLRDAFPEAKLKLSGSVDIPQDTGTLDTVFANMNPDEQRQFIELLAKSIEA